MMLKIPAHYAAGNGLMYIFFVLISVFSHHKYNNKKAKNNMVSYKNIENLYQSQE